LWIAPLDAIFSGVSSIESVPASVVTRPPAALHADKELGGASGHGIRAREEAPEVGHGRTWPG
jgi:hypothetical protein